jgi:hypothetical protein
MNCAEARPLLDAFVDAELPGPTLLALARHAGGCVECDGALRELAALHDAVERTVTQAVETLDLRGVWPRIEAGMERVEAQRTRRARLRAVPTWGAAAAAVAAGAILWFRAAGPEPARVATRPRPNQAVIERLNSAGARFELRRERKNGTTLIMVSADEEVSR